MDFTHVYQKIQRLEPAWPGYAVRHKSQLKIGCESAAIWRYGIGLAYIEDGVTSTELRLSRTPGGGGLKLVALNILLRSGWHHPIE